MTKTIPGDSAAPDTHDALMRNEMAHAIVLSLISQGYISGSDAASIGLAFLRELEEQGWTLRLTTGEERRAHREPGGSS